MGTAHHRAIWANKTALIVGLGGLGSPAALALAEAGVGTLILVDDDVVEFSNLHRQILYADADVGRHKLDVARERLLARAGSDVVTVRSRLLPDNARELVRRADVVLEGADNFATKFLAADACGLEVVPIVHGAAVRLVGTVLSVGAHGRACYRCLFEDVLPIESAPNCAEAGVLGPVVGVVGALMADLALDVLSDDCSRTSVLHSYDAKTDLLRAAAVHARTNCPLCGSAKSISDTLEARYLAPSPPSSITF